MDRAPLESWQAENLRLTAFPASPMPQRDPAWWVPLVGEPPEAITERLKEGLRVQHGPLLGGVLVNEIRPIRVDWILIPSPAVDMGEAPVLPVVGPFADLS